MRNTTGLDHPTTIAVVAGLGLGGSAVLATMEPLPTWELDLTEAINSVPDVVATALWPVMQLGTLVAPIGVAVGILVLAHDRWRAGAALAAGIASWFVAKGVKRVFERGRPLEYLPGIEVREGAGTGLGYVSGHSAVAAACAVCLAAVLPPRWRWVPAAVAALTGIARIVHGVHLPADVVGGWSLGVLIGVAALWIAGRLGGAPRREAHT